MTALTQIGEYGPNCTQYADTPHPPVPLLREPTTLKSVAITKGAANAEGRDWDWVDGTVVGLTCFVPPPKEEWAWPYGGGEGGFNAVPTDAAGQPIQSSPSGGGEESGAGKVVPVMLGSVLGALATLAFL